MKQYKILIRVYGNLPCNAHAYARIYKNKSTRSLLFTQSLMNNQRNYLRLNWKDTDWND